jgi:hypothetical protein
VVSAAVKAAATDGATACATLSRGRDDIAGRSARGWFALVQSDRGRYKLSAQNAGFRALEKSKQPLILLGLQIAFQADDEGSIPFTRSTFNISDLA